MYIIEKGSSDTIFIEDLNDSHLIVAKIEEDACILAKIRGDYLFDVIGTTGSAASRLCCHGLSNDRMQHKTIQSIVKEALKREHKVAAFEMQDYKSALQWLIDN